MRVLTWNLNRSAARRRIPAWIGEEIAAGEPDVLVVTEYVTGVDHEAFTAQLAAAGLRCALTTDRVSRQNQVLVVAREQVERGPLHGSLIHPSVPPNVLHTLLPNAGIECLAIRVPVFEHELRPLKGKTWEWLIETAAALKSRAAFITGDLNTDPRDRLRRLHE